MYQKDKEVLPKCKLCDHVINSAMFPSSSRIIYCTTIAKLYVQNTCLSEIPAFYSVK